MCSSRLKKIEQLALINRLTTHHDLRPSLKASDDGIMIRQYPRGLFQHHRSKSVLWLCPLHGRFSTKNRHSSARIQRHVSCHDRTHPLRSPLTTSGKKLHFQPEEVNASIPASAHSHALLISSASYTECALYLARANDGQTAGPF